MNFHPAMRASVGLIIAFIIMLVTPGYASTTVSDRHPVRTFLLLFQLPEYVVPAEESWRLCWSSPYQPGDCCPGYDVRVTEGLARLGANGEIQASAYDHNPGKNGLLDLSATKGEAVVWLGPDTRFSLANDLLQIEVTAFSPTTQERKTNDNHKQIPDRAIGRIRCP